MATYPGKRNKATCIGVLYRCKNCGNVGCERGGQNECTNQAFRSGKCLKCGSIGHRETFR